MLKYSRTVFAVLTIMVLFVASKEHQTDRNDEKGHISGIVRAAERYRGNAWDEFRFVVEISSVEKGIVVSRIEAEIFVSEKDKNRNVLMYIRSGEGAPLRILQKNTSMWRYKPGTTHAIRISPQQHLLGKVSYADVTYGNYEYFFSPIKMEETTLNDRPTYEIVLEKNDRAVVYDVVRLFVDEEGMWPVKAEIHSGDGERKKTMHFYDFEETKERALVRNWAVIGEGDRATITYIIIKKMDTKKLPASAYTVEDLKRSERNNGEVQ